LDIEAVERAGGGVSHAQGGLGGAADPAFGEHRIAAPADPDAG
jgi:hypothetical protein